MQVFLDFLKSLYNAERLLELVRALLGNPLGLAGLFAIVFAETGLLVGFFLPGDSLLFSVGVASGATSIQRLPSGRTADVRGHCGRQRRVHARLLCGAADFQPSQIEVLPPRSPAAHQRVLRKARLRAVVYARFIPIIRTCTPFIAGVARMRYTRFLLFSLFGGIFWIAFMTTLGYRLGQIDYVRRNFEKVVIAIVLLSLVPVALEARKRRTET